MPEATRKKPDFGDIPAKPARNCDIVMKGGVTSGIVYPLAICELAREYRFVNVGGTSAGAIAAVLTAAAEYRRRNGDVVGFSKHLASLPHIMALKNPDGSSLLVSLFQPNDSTKPLHETLFGLVKTQGLWRYVSTLWRLFRMAPAGSLLGAMGWVLGLLLIWYLSQTVALALALPSLVIVLLALMAVPILLGLHITRKGITSVARNGYGLSKGLLQNRSQNTPKPLTEWLADTIDEVAGKPGSTSPLTFGDLWGEQTGDEGAKKERSINLEMITTNLTQGRPYRLPFERAWFHFSPEEFRTYFPGRIVDWMVSTSEPSDDPRYRKLPKPADLPVVVAARLSLSFPLLISAVPLYAVDWSTKRNKDKSQPPELERCWFSDGGICSNFPVHLFDSPLPRWPTFAINLRPFHPDFPRDMDERKNIWMARTNGSGTLEQWVRFNPQSSPSSLVDFLVAIFDTMQTWMDNTQLKMPGYRDRVAHVYLDKQEGGLNLSMDSEAIERISTRGQMAGERLRTQFTSPDPELELSWDNHRWVRYRSTMMLLEGYLGAIADRYPNSFQPGDRSYRELVNRGTGELPHSYPWEPGQQELAKEVGEKIIQLMVDWRADNENFAEGAPRPNPELRIRPKI
jgi:predicted acylesterase/phospholipase RssA